MRWLWTGSELAGQQQPASNPPAALPTRSQTMRPPPTAALEVADGEFVEPTGELNATAVAELVKLAPAAGDASAGWSAFNSMCASAACLSVPVPGFGCCCYRCVARMLPAKHTMLACFCCNLFPHGQLLTTHALRIASPQPPSSSPGRYPVCYWGFATLASDLTAEGARGLYIRDVGKLPCLCVGVSSCTVESWLVSAGCLCAAHAPIRGLQFCHRRSTQPHAMQALQCLLAGPPLALLPSLAYHTLAAAAAGHLLTPEGQELVGTDSDEYPLPKPLMPAALDAWARYSLQGRLVWQGRRCRTIRKGCAGAVLLLGWLHGAVCLALQALGAVISLRKATPRCFHYPAWCSIKTAASDVVTGIPVPVVAESAAPAPTPAPAPGSGAAGMAAGAPLLAAALAAVLMLA